MTATGMMVWWKSFNSIQVLAIYTVLRLSLRPSERRGIRACRSRLFGVLDIIYTFLHP